jgi:hypothetical protein
LAHDPYDVYPNPSEDYDGLGRVYFARSPGSGVWVWFGDLSDETTDALWSRHSSKLMFPAGLEQLLNQLGGRDVQHQRQVDDCSIHKQELLDDDIPFGRGLYPHDRAVDAGCDYSDPGAAWSNHIPRSNAWGSTGIGLLVLDLCGSQQAAGVMPVEAFGTLLLLVDEIYRLVPRAWPFSTQFQSIFLPTEAVSEVEADLPGRQIEASLQRNQNEALSLCGMA